MSFNFPPKDLMLNSQFSLIAISSFLAATTIIGVLLYTRRSDENPGLPPLFIGKTTSKGNYKRRWVHDNDILLQEAYKKFHDRPFRIWSTEGIQIGIHPKYVEEVKLLPDTIFPSALRTYLLGPYMWPIDQWKIEYPHQVLKNELNKSLPSLYSSIRDVIALNFPRDYPDCHDWKPIQVFPRMVRMVSRVSTKVFVGNGLEQNEDWLEISTNYTKNVFVASAKLRWFNPVFRPFVQYFMSELHTVWRSNRRAEELLTPILSQRLALEKNKDYQKPNDSIEWIRDLVAEQDRNDVFLHGIFQLAIASVSVGSTSHLLTNTIFNLAAWPEYQPILKQEIQDVLYQAGGEWTAESMGKLEKLDSFIKESLRYCGHATTTFQRLARQDITLSDGTFIPAGTMVFTFPNAINFDSNIYQEPTTFDGLRFYKLRKMSPENEKKYLLTTTNREQMQFGAGRHGCSGKQMASYQMKLILASLIGKYEFKLKEGEGRPKNSVFMTHQHADVKGEVLFKNRG